MSQGVLSSETRSAALQAMSTDPLDVLIVGGGVVGAGAAVDAATRGLRVGLVEALDYASGTSSRSSKLVHGGLRYLEMLDFGLVREALRERGLILQRLAPHLSQPVPFLYPLQRRGWERPYVGSGVMLYDTLGFEGGASRGVPRHRHMTRQGALRAAPALSPDALVGAIQYYDGQIDDARHTMTLVRTAARYGALVANRARVTEFLRDGDRVIGARIQAVESSETFEVRATAVINATGVWTDDTQGLVTDRGQYHVRMSKGIHLVVPRDRIRSNTGLILRTEKSVLFVIPWSPQHWIIGTTDTDWSYGKAHPAASAADIDYLLEHVNSVLATPLTRADIMGVFVGLRPLVAGKSATTAKLSREHVVSQVAPGFVIVAGGKYTTYRVMAKDAVDAVVNAFGGKAGKCITERVPCLGAEGYEAMWNRRQRLAEETGLPVERVEHLLRRYGSMIEDLLPMLSAEPELVAPLEGAERYLGVEIAYAATHEGARHLDDVLSRRTHISIETWDRGLAAAPYAARILGRVLGWSDEQIDSETSHYRSQVEAERRSHEQPDDEAADAARAAAADIVPDSVTAP